jgi:hypothetical protein
MPSVIDTPEVGEHKKYDRDEEQPQVRAAHRGFWHTVVQSIRRHRVHRRHSTSSSSPVSLHPFETPAERFARHYPFLYIQAGSDL